MSLATSPTTNAVEQQGVVTNQEFGRYIKYFQDGHKALMKWKEIVSNAPASGVTVDTDEGEKVMTRKAIARYSQDYVNQLNDLKKIFANRKKKSTRSSNHLHNSLFYVSDQLVAFYTKANLGPIDPETGKGKLADKLKILTEKRMATSGILTSLFTQYIRHNNLKKETGRISVDTRMKKAFATTNYRLNATDLSKRSISGVSDAEKQVLKDKLTDSKKSAFARLDGCTDKRGLSIYDSKEGFLWTCMMKINNFYRVPKQLLSESEQAALTDPANFEEAKELQEILTHIKNHHKAQTV